MLEKFTQLDNVVRPPYWQFLEPDEPEYTMGDGPPREMDHTDRLMVQSTQLALIGEMRRLMTKVFELNRLLIDTPRNPVYAPEEDPTIEDELEVNEAPATLPAL